MKSPIILLLCILLTICSKFASAEYFSLLDHEHNTATIIAESKTTISRLSDFADVFKGKFSLTPFVTFDGRLTLTLQRLFRSSTGHDELFVLEVKECSPTPCDTSKQAFAFTRKSGLLGNIHGASDFTESNKWSTALALMYSMQFEPQSKNLNASNQKLNDSTYRKQATLDDAGIQGSLIKALRYGSRFLSTSTYKVGKMNAVEKLTVEEEYTLSAYSVQLIHASSRTEFVFEPHKQAKSLPSCKKATLEDCGEELIKSRKFVRISDLIEDFYYSRLTANLALLEEGEKKDCILGDAKAFKRLNKFGSHHSAKVLHNMVHRGKSATKEGVLECLADKRNATNLFSMLTVFALTGNFEVYATIKDKLYANFDHYSAWRHFLSVLPYAINPDPKILDDLMVSIKHNNNEIEDISILPAASILSKQLSNNRKRHDEDIESYVDIFIDKFERCPDDDCFKIMLISFENLRHDKLVNVVGKYLCTTFKHDGLILRFLKRMPQRLWNSDTFTRSFLRIFKNRCPTPKDQSTRLFASYLLLTSATAENSDKITTDLLHFLENGRGSALELKSYLLTLIKDLAESKPAIFRRVYTKLYEGRYYNEGLQMFAGGSASRSSTKAIDLFGLFRPYYGLDIEFNRGAPKRISADFGMIVDDKPSTLFGLELYSTALMSSLDMFGGSDSTTKDASVLLPSSNDEDCADKESAEAGLALSLFDHNQPAIPFFASQAGLMGAVWSADGTSLIAYNDSIILNDFLLSLPIATGHVIEMKFGSALSLAIGGSVEISIWYRTLKADLWNKGSFNINGNFVLRNGFDSARHHLLQQNLDLFINFGSAFSVDADFYASPAELCFQIDASTAELQLSTKQDVSKSFTGTIADGEKTFLRKFDGGCANIPKLSRACSCMYE